MNINNWEGVALIIGSGRVKLILLFAFVISGVFVGSGVSQSQSIGEINGEEIDYESFNLIVQQVQDAYGLDYSNAINYAWEIGVSNTVLVQELEKLGRINTG